MKKILILLIFVVSVYANNENYELKLYEKILPTLFNEDFTIFASDKSVIENSTVLKTTQQCENADLIICKRSQRLSARCEDKPVFCTSYRSFKESKNCIGAFYWRKGRPQIKFKLDIINKFNLHLPKSLREFAK